MSVLDDLHAAMAAGGEPAGMAFYRALADAELFLLLEAEAVGEVMSPRVFDLAQGPVVLVFDSEERLAGFADGAVAYAALPGRVIAGQMAGQALSLGLNLGSGAASEVILPPEALDWLMAMLDQKAPEAMAARAVGFSTPMVPENVSVALVSVLLAGMRGYLVGVRYAGGQGQMLALTGVDAASEGRVARAVTEALAFSGVEAGALDVAFLTEGDAMLRQIAAVAWVIEGGGAVDAPEALRREGPGMDPARPPILR